MEVFVDSQQVVSKTYGDWPQLIFIRPDGYIGFRAAGQDINKLEAYLHRIFPRNRE